MEKYNVLLLDSDATDSLSQMVSSFIQTNEITVVQISHSSCYDIENKKTIFSVAIGYTYYDGEKYKSNIM